MFQANCASPAIFTARADLRLISARVDRVDFVRLLQISLLFTPTFVWELSNVIRNEYKRKDNHRGLSTVAELVRRLPPAGVNLYSVFLQASMKVRLLDRALTVGTWINTVVAIGVIFGQATSVMFGNFGTTQRERLRARARRIQCFNVLINDRLLNRLSNANVISSVGGIRLD